MFQENDDQNETLRNETSSPLFFGPSAFSFSSFLRYNHSSLDLTCSSIYFTSLNGRIIDLESEKCSLGVNQLYYFKRRILFKIFFACY